MNVWPELFRGCGHHDATFNMMGHILEKHPFCKDADVALSRDRLRTCRREEKDKKRWALNGNSVFSVKSFYNFSNDGGLRCDIE